MCGIAGVLSLNPNKTNLFVLKQMTDSIAHRGHNGDGHWINEDGTIGFGHRRLSIIDLSKNGSQPMHYLNRYTIVLNGEIYNYIELKQELQKKGYQFKSNSDTEVLMALYDLKKEKCLDDIDGMFAFAIWDNKERLTFCARDRFGEKPFYYHQTNDAFYFASEMKALWAVGIKKQPNERRVFLYLAYNTTDDIKNPISTFYKDIFLLEPAHYLIIKDGKIISNTRYWDIDLSNKSTISHNEAKEKFYFLFEQSIKRRLRSDVPVGSCLSGGLDSSSIVSIINKVKDSNQTQKTFSARFKDFNKDEGKRIDLVVKNNDVESYQVFLTPEMLVKEIDNVFYYQEEPYGSTSIVAQWYVMKLVKENNITVLLDGQGADEILAGYIGYFRNFFSSLILSDKNKFQRQLSEYNNLHNTKYNIENYFWLHSRFPHLRHRLRYLRNKIVKPDYISQFKSDFIHEFDSYEEPFEYPNNLNKALYISATKRGLNTLLRYADRNSMANGREVRLPFLNHELVEFVFSLSDEFKINNGWTKVILREVMKDILPQEVCWQKEKIGFEPPNCTKVGSDMANQAINALAKNGIINPKHALNRFTWDYYQTSKLYSL
ncbi:MAG: asparagine synthase (glutamine-hydrolyzing) [Bacteroidia bacterium]|nr:asparagine synthase (glutamine-hydrolyzing) [Bacteroidia bacterium]